MKKQSKRVTEISDQHYIIFPHDLNSQDKMFGGMLVGVMDKIAGCVFALHNENQPFGTKYIDGMPFEVVVHKGDILLLDAAINRVWETSCEIGVRARVRRSETGVIQNLSYTYFTFVAIQETDEIDPNTHKPKVVAVPIKYDVQPETQEQRRRWREAGARRRRNLKNQKNKKS